MSKRSDYLTVKEFAKRAGCSPSTVWRRIKQGKVKAIRLKCLYCAVSKRCQRVGDCSRVLMRGEYRGIPIAFTVLPKRGQDGIHKQK